LIGLIDYGLGNLNAFINAYKKIGVKIVCINRSEDLDKFDKYILPGVGSFDKAISQLNYSGLLNDLKIQVLNNKKKILGVCVGMQILGNNSEEGKLSGLGWIDGSSKKFRVENLKVPHMGWNSISIKDKDHPLFFNLDEESYFYFLHSYYFSALNKKNEKSLTNYNIDFCSAVSFDNIFAVQFHPEKSHENGLKILKNFNDMK
jgi:glutamine amidotransferase